MSRVLTGKRPWPKMQVGAPDPSLTRVSGMAAVTELCERLIRSGRWMAWWGDQDAGSRPLSGRVVGRVGRGAVGG